jgi:hypothetical protein
VDYLKKEGNFMLQKQKWTLVTSIILTVLGVIVFGIASFFTLNDTCDATTIIASIICMLYALFFWMPTWIHSTPKVFLINFANALCCGIGWIVALVFAILDKKNPNGTSMPTWNQNPTWDNTNAQNYWGNGQNNQWGNSNGVQSQQPVQPTNWEDSPNQNIPDNNSGI